MSQAAAHAESSLPLEILLRLPARGPAALDEILLLARRGDWRARTLALSAAGQIVRDDPTAWSPHPFRHRVARRVPFLRRRFPSVGPRGAFARGAIANGVVDRAWIVRTAAALALGECPDAALVATLRPLLRDPYRPVRIVAATGLARLGAPLDVEAAALLAEQEPTPARIGDVEDAREWLGRLAAGHRSLLALWLAVPDAPAPDSAAPDAWARFLAGPTREIRHDSRQAEIVRYAQEKETHYNFTKPFTPVNREQNVRLLHSFLVVAESLRAPRGARVLDLGGGAGWVSELLTKLGYAPVTLDIAPSLIRVGRDRFTREHLPFRPVAGDMTRLPVRDGAMDAVVVIDALHHAPDVAAVFREAYRVLAPGGQFVLAEPGEGHSETEKSRGETATHGVCEGEIHLFDAVGFGREAGFDETRAVPHYVPSVAMTPDDVRYNMSATLGRWRVRHGDVPASFDEFVMQSMLSHPVLVFTKGRRALDSRMPGRLRARLAPRLAREGPRVTGSVAVRNEGDTIWRHGDGEPGSVRLGLQLMTPDRQLLDLDFSRARLVADLAAGSEVAVSIDVRLPDATAGYVLKLDMVDEHVCWFEDHGSKPVYVALLPPNVGEG